jgi:hypothetical protein
MRRPWIALTTICVLASAAPPASARAARRARGKPPTLTVSAGDFDRKDTPVPVSLPAELAGKRFELRGPGGRLPLDVDGQGNGAFVLPALAKGKRASYQLRELKAAGRTAGGEVEVERQGDDVDVLVAGRRVLRYQADAARADAGKDVRRGGYLHPVFTPSGIPVTGDSPADDRHRQGIFTAWATGATPARPDHLSTGEAEGGAAAGRFTTQLSSTDRGVTPPRPVLKARWTVTVWRMPAAAGGLPAYHLFDLDSTEEAAGSAPLELAPSGDGGLGVRGPGDWQGKDRTNFLTSEGKDRTSGDGTRARWVHMSGKVGPTLAGIAALDHPDNVRAPQPVHLCPAQPCFVYAPGKAGKLTLEPGKPQLSRHRFVVADGAPDRALLDRLWNDYAHPPAAELKP